jgi:hypothetical protein
VSEGRSIDLSKGISKEQIAGIAAMFGFDLSGVDFSKYEGITDEDKVAALKEDLKDILGQLVAAGKITQETADKAIEKINEYELPEGFTFPDYFTFPEDFTLPEGFTFPDGFEFIFPEDFTLPEGFTFPDGFEFPDISLPDFNLPDLTIPDVSKYEGMTPAQKSAAVKADLAVILGELLADGSISKKQSDWLKAVADVLLDEYLKYAATATTPSLDRTLSARQTAE